VQRLNGHRDGRRDGRGDLAQAIARLARVRHVSPALRHGDYRQLEVRSEQLAFARQVEGEAVIVDVNAASEPAAFDLEVPGGHGGALIDLLNPGQSYPVRGGRAQIQVGPRWARVLQVAA